MKDFPTTPPHCPHCLRAMQLNTAVSTEYLRQYLCGCRGEATYVNLHRGQKGRGE